MWSGVKLTRKQLTSRPDHQGQNSGIQWESTPSWRRSKSGRMKKLHLDNARKLRGIYFIDPEDKEFKETIKNARKKLETSVALAMPCKVLKIFNCGSNKIKTNLRVFWKVMNPQECVWETRYRIIMKTILQEKVKIHYNTTTWFTNLFLCFSSYENSSNKGSSGQGMWKIAENIGVEPDKQKFISHHWWTCVLWKMLNWRQNTKNTKVELYSVVNIEKYDSGSYAVFTEQGSSASQMTAAKIMDIISPDCLVARDQQPGKTGGCSQIIENSQFGMSRHLDSSTTTQMPKSWSSMEDPVVPLERNLYGHPLAGLLWERQLEKILLQHGWEKVSNWVCSIVHRQKG